MDDRIPGRAALGRQSVRDVVPVQGSASLFDRERAPMVRLAVLLVGSPQVAEELVQDAFAVVAQRWESLDNPGGYLRTCVVNNARMHLRRRSLERHHHELGIDVVGVDEMPTQLIELRDAMERLPERQRVVIVLRYFADVTDVEIAETLACRPSTVRSLARRALRALREELT